MTGTKVKAQAPLGQRVSPAPRKLPPQDRQPGCRWSMLLPCLVNQVDGAHMLAAPLLQDFLGSPFQTSFLHLWAHPPPWDPQGQGPWGRGPLAVGTVPGLSGTACLLRAWLAADGSTQECGVGGGIPASLPRRVLRPPAASCCPSRRTELSISGSWSWQHQAPT